MAVGTRTLLVEAVGTSLGLCLVPLGIPPCRRLENRKDVFRIFIIHTANRTLVPTAPPGSFCSLSSLSRIKTLSLSLSHSQDSVSRLKTYENKCGS